MRDLYQRDHFGELGILTHRKRSMSVRVTSPTCTLAKLNKEGFQRIIFSIESKLNKDFKQAFDRKLREVLQSKNASQYPLEHIFSEYNLKYIQPNIEDYS